MGKCNDSSKKRKRRKIAQRDGAGCLLCGYNEDILTLHHVVKKSDGGSDHLDNLVLLCEDCHCYWHQNEASDFFLWVEQTRTFLRKMLE